MNGKHHRPFHILQVVHSLIIGGTERVVSDLTRHFNDGKYRTSVCCLDELGDFGKDLIEAGIRVKVLNRKPGIDYSLLGELRSLYREWNIDLVHTHQYTPYFYGAAACLGFSYPKAIFTEHGRHQPDRIRLKRVFFNRVLGIVTSKCTAVSEFTRRSIMEFEKIPFSRIRVIYNGVPDSGEGTLEAKRISREKLGIGLSRKVVLSIGRMDPIKDFRTLILAFAEVVRNIPEALLLIAGGGDENYQGELRHCASDLGIGDHVILLGSRRDVTDLLAACDIFTLTSISEAASMTILEAMAAGRPVVATRTGGNPEIVVHGDTGYLVPVGDYESVAKALTDLMVCPDLAVRMGATGRARFEAHFTIDATFASYRELYEEILAR